MGGHALEGRDVMPDVHATVDQPDPADVLVIRFQSDLSHDRAAELMRTLSDAIKAGSTRIALDLSAVAFTSDSSLGAIIKSCKSAREAGGDVRLFGLSRAVRNFFDAMGLKGVLQCFGNEKDAIQSFEE